MKFLLEDWLEQRRKNISESGRPDSKNRHLKRVNSGKLHRKRRYLNK